jgi:hypothetical protein
MRSVVLWKSEVMEMIANEKGLFLLVSSLISGEFANSNRNDLSLCWFYA